MIGTPARSASAHSQASLGKRRHEVRPMKREPEPEHSGLAAPAGECFPGCGGLGIEASHDRKTIRMSPCSGKRKIVALAFPGGRHDDGACNARGVHFAEQLVLAERSGPVRSMARRPRAFRRIGSPDVHLGVGDQHAARSFTVFGARRASRGSFQQQKRFYM
jgi:hypothetical protein